LRFHHEGTEVNEENLFKSFMLFMVKKQPKPNMHKMIHHVTHFIITVSGSDSLRQGF